ncbi:glucose-1-phosphate cytidylyltransferase [Planctomycetales bacterium]|nr:glucose-1-phosphate cytidylyltransferase [Planctomycetales bacterium]
MKVVILAGGYGTRISAEGSLTPKPMIEIGERPILWHIMKYYSHFGHNEFIICCGYQGFTIKEYFANYYLHRSDVTFDFTGENRMTVHKNVAEPWKVTLVDTGIAAQTGGRIKRVQKYVGTERFMLTYGDGVGDVDLAALLKQHEKSENTVTLTAVQPGGRFGVLDIEGKNITSFREKTKEDGGWINAGFMVVEPAVFDLLKDDGTVFEQKPLMTLSQNGKLGAYQHRKFWQCMDTPRDKNLLEQLWRESRSPWKVW